MHQPVLFEDTSSAETFGGFLGCSDPKRSQADLCESASQHVDVVSFGMQGWEVANRAKASGSAAEREREELVVAIAAMNGSRSTFGNEGKDPVRQRDGRGERLGRRFVHGVRRGYTARLGSKLVSLPKLTGTPWKRTVYPSTR